jgi:phage terminase large subunit
MQRVIGSLPVVPYGGENVPSKLVYPNGSAIWIGGMDSHDKVLSGERDFIQVCQAEQLKVEDWETMSTRVTGRSAVIPFPQIFGDCNPGGSQHWILERAKAGSLRIIQSRQQDNPTLFNEDGTLTPQGIRTMRVLESLTGVRKQRLLYNKWVTAEGTVYDTYNPDVHVVKRNLSDFRRFVMCMDEGYTNPAVILLIGIDGDGRQHIFREFYKTGILQKDVVAAAKGWAVDHKVGLIAVDAAAAGLIADLVDVGLHAVPAKGRVLDGINLVQSLLKVQGDGKPRLTVDPECVNVINEFESYIWKPEKDEPVKENDHSMDALRYLQIALDTSGPTMEEWIAAFKKANEAQE